MPAESLSASAARVQAALHGLGLSCDVRELDATTRTARDAANAVGCEVGQIVKSLVFRGATSGRTVLVLASGANRVNEDTLAALLGEPAAKADPDFVRAETGFAIGGVPPVGHPQPLTTLLDAALLRYDAVWAAAGTPHAVFRITPDELLRATGARVAELAQ